MDFIGSVEELRAHYKPASERALAKENTFLDAHCRRLIAASPFVMIGSFDGAGNADVTPKGDRPGFVQVLDDHTLAIPDRPGNNRLDTLENVLRNPAVGLIFLIPGMNETLRVNGIARLTVDRDLCARFAVEDRPAISVMLVTVRAAYMHCAKAFMRSELWKPQTWPTRETLPTLGEILRDHAAAGPADATDRSLADSYSKTMW